MSNNLSKGEQKLSGKTLTDNVPLFRDLFEVLLLSTDRLQHSLTFVEFLL